MTAAARLQRRMHVTGIVQGVGFRPFVHRLAEAHGLAGYVRNQSGDVEIVVEGNADDIERFAEALRDQAPPLARIDDVDFADLEGDDAVAVDTAFRILESRSIDGRRQPVPADVAMCSACEAELFDPANRRFEYPFITCTDCGPRYTVIESLPYDRERTTMRHFTQCPACFREYNTVGDRRYHSETNSCPVCGPLLWARFADELGDPPSPLTDSPSRALSLAAAYLRGGGIVAIRGVGGFHLAVDATNDGAVTRLRERKRREAKPLAVMVRSLDDARRIARVCRREAELLADRSRPIVLLRARPDSQIAGSVAPGMSTLGVMLAYTPLHHLLLQRIGRPLVMTSGNRSEEPIAASIEAAEQRLGSIADLFLFHNRDIVSPVDDSVMRVQAGRATILRRGRGHAPMPLALPHAVATPLLAVGGHLKNTFTLAAGREAFVSPHLGDLDSMETLTHFRETLERYSRLFRIVPEVVARDLHSGYLSTRLAQELGAPEIIVQHHHAHIAAVLGEHRRDGRVIGVAFDGTGAGDDGTVWGAEFLIADQAQYTRAAHLRSAPLPGGERAIRTPWRSALGFISLQPGMAATFGYAFTGVDATERQAAEHQLRTHVNSPIASSMGRLFDAAAAVLGVCRFARFEGDAAMRLESLAGSRHAGTLPFPIIEDGECLELDPLPLLIALAERATQGDAVEDLAAAFHDSVCASTTDVVARLAESHDIRAVALGGGVFQNARLGISLRARLEARGFDVLTPIDLPANDGGLSYGQAVVAAARLRTGGG